MKRRIISVVIVISMLISSFAFTSYAAEPGIDEMREAFKAVDTAVNNMKSLLGDEQASTLSKIFSGFVGATSVISPIFGTVNGGITFLKLVGLMKDSNAETLANIMRELSIISDKMNEMDKKLDNITDSVTTLHASTEFNDRMNKALAFNEGWRSFRREYMENGLDKKMTDYNAKILNGLKAWFLNEKPDSRTEGGVDNSKITVIFVKDDDGTLHLYLTGKNNVPSSAEYLTFEISSNELPKSFEWNVNTNEERLTAVFRDILSTKIPDLSGSPYSYDSLVELVAQGAYATLVYRVACKELNKDATFSLDVARLFDNYCANLFKSGEGIDAYVKALFLTHTFEYEVSEEINGFFDRMILETATYGAFVSGVLSMSDFTTDDDLNTRLNSISKAINSLENARSSCITGRPGYCYVTNCELAYGYDAITMSGEYKVRTEPLRDYDFATAAYLGGKVFQTTITPFINGKKDAGLVGDKNALVIMYTLRANGITPSNAYFSEKIGNGKVTDYGPVMTGRNGQTELGFGDSVQMQVNPLIGVYFSGKKQINFNSRPSKCDDEDFTFRQKITGSLLDLSTTEIKSNSMLAAFAGYAEDHWYWDDDEVAFLCGPDKKDNSVNFSLTEHKEYYGVAHIGYDRTYTIKCVFFYNTIHCIAPEPSIRTNNNEYDPLGALEGINTELGVERTSADPGTDGNDFSDVGNGKKVNLTFVIGISAGAVAAAAAIIVILDVKKKKKKKMVV